MNHYNLFTVNAPTTIYSVDVFAQGAGLVDVVVQNAATLATVQTVTVPSTGPGFNRLVVNISLPPGNYRMGSTTTNNAGGLQRNSSGAVFPYLSTDGSVTITGTTFNTTSYYYFYNWQLGGGGCPRPDGEVTLYHEPATSASFTSTPQAATATNMTVDFDASATANATSYDWNFGDGSTGTGVQTSHSYAVNGAYNVTLIAGGACGADTLVIPVTVAGINVAETPLDRSLSVYPNPTAGVFRVDFELGSSQRVEVKVLNATGQTVWVRSMDSVNGLQHQSIDLSEASAGLYLLQLTTEEGVVTRRIAVQK
jgi:PKD repeat protein